MGTLLQDATIVTMNPQREVLVKADLLIEGDRIEKIFPGGSAHKRAGWEEKGTRTFFLTRSIASV